MATLTVRNLDEGMVRRLRIQAAEHGRSAEAEHRAILRAALSGSEQPPTRLQTAERLADFRRRTSRSDTPAGAVLLGQSRAERMATLTGTGEDA